MADTPRRTAPSLPCPACDSRSSESLPPPPPPLLPGEEAYTWGRCTDCGSHHAAPRKSMDYDAAYEEAATYTWAHRAYREQMLHVRDCRNGEWYNRSIAHHLLLAASPPGRLLDIGAGNGFLMGLAHEAGFAVEGIEASEVSRRSIESHIRGSRMHASVDTVEGAFTHVSLLEVLEHVESPVDFARSLRARLETGGMLILSVPNVDRPYWRFGARSGERRHWMRGGGGDTAPHHLTRFTRAGLRRVLERAGFGAVHVGYTPFDVTSWMHHDLEVPASLPFRFAGFPLRIPLTVVRAALVEHVGYRLWESDESLGQGLMALATDGKPDGAAIEAAFRAARAEVMRRHLRFHGRDLLSRAWTDRRAIARGLASFFGLRRRS